MENQTHYNYMYVQQCGMEKLRPQNIMTSVELQHSTNQGWENPCFLEKVFRFFRLLKVFQILVYK